jgi:hypothetical protein
MGSASSIPPLTLPSRSSHFATLQAPGFEEQPVSGQWEVDSLPEQYLELEGVSESIPGGKGS